MVALLGLCKARGDEFFQRVFFECGSFIRSLNATFFILLPNKGGVEDMKDFTINLVRKLYNMLTKVMTNRLKKVVGKVVSDFQHAFVEKGKFWTWFLLKTWS